MHLQEETAHLEDGPSVSAETFERIGCDSSVVVMHEDRDGNLLNIERKSRSIPPALRRALKYRDGGCRFPGCTAKRFVDGHHIRHWSHGGETGLANLVLLCRVHHRLVHEGGFSVRAQASGAIVFTRPDGVRIPFCGGHGDDGPGPRRPDRLPDTAAKLSTWNGDRLDYGMALDILIQRTRSSEPAGAISNTQSSRKFSRSSALDGAISRISALTTSSDTKGSSFTLR
jgi:hypothetical protein